MKNRRWGVRLLALAAFGLMGAATSAPAAVVVAEYFDYGAANITGAATAPTPFSGDPWYTQTSQFAYRESDVAANNASWAGSGYELSTDNNGTGSMRVGTTSPRGVEMVLDSTLSGEFWVSVMMRAEAGVGVNETLSVAFNSASSFVGNNSGGFGLGIANVGGTLRSAIVNSSGMTQASGTGTLTAGTGSANFYLLVGRVTQANSGNDTIELWTFANNAAVPTSVGSLGSPAVSYTGNWSTSPFTRLQFFSNAADGSIDALRVSNLSGNAGYLEAMGIVPEPATAGMLMLALALLSRRTLHALRRA